jgi:hypothetical protein
MVKIVMHRRLAAIVLLIVLVGANTAVASVCAACCAVEQSRDHHNQTETMSSTSHHHPDTQHRMAGCGQCPLSMGMAGIDPERCAEVQALLQKTRVYSSDRATRQGDTLATSTFFLPTQANSARSSHFHPPPKLTGFSPTLVSLRI